MTWTTKIAIPTRGDRTTTYDNLPEELKEYVTFYSPVQMVGKTVITNTSGIAEKRQLIHESHEEPYIMVDDDVSFGYYDGKYRKTELKDFLEFQEMMRKEFSQGTAVYSSSLRAFINSAQGKRRYSSGKFCAHNKELLKGIRYDKNIEFEDTEFFLQCITERLPLIISNNFYTHNRMEDRPEKVSRGEIIRRWIVDYPDAIKVRELEIGEKGEFAGKTVPYKIMVKYFSCTKEKLATL